MQSCRLSSSNKYRFLLPEISLGGFESADLDGHCGRGDEGHEGENADSSTNIGTHGGKAWRPGQGALAAPQGYRRL